MMEDLDRMSSFLKGVYNSEANKNILNLLLTPAQINASDTYLDLQEYYQTSNLEKQNRESRMMVVIEWLLISEIHIS